MIKPYRQETPSVDEIIKSSIKCSISEDQGLLKKYLELYFGVIESGSKTSQFFKNFETQKESAIKYTTDIVIENFAKDMIFKVFKSMSVDKKNIRKENCIIKGGYLTDVERRIFIMFNTIKLESPKSPQDVLKQFLISETNEIVDFIYDFLKIDTHAVTFR
jgi:hypothetical protein